jgi:hypothetical protein
MRQKQTLEHVNNMAKKYNKGEVRMKPWDAVELMETFVDVSDPDVELPQIVHMLQTAESIRNAGLPGVCLCVSEKKSLFLWMFMPHSFITPIYLHNIYASI